MTSTRTPSTLRVLAILLVVAALAEATNPSYDPNWVLGDSWGVRFTVTLAAGRKTGDATSTQPETRDLVYTYTVTSVESGRVTIVAEPDQPGFGRWRLTFRTSPVALIMAEELLAGAPPIAYDNPFGADAWLPELHRFGFAIIHDFSRLPDSDTDESRLLQPLRSGTPGFRQVVTFGPDSATAMLSRDDPVSDVSHSTTLVWHQQRKWWSSAITTLGDDVIVEGVLVF
jgi:hypothetical protein